MYVFIICYTLIFFEKVTAPLHNHTVTIHFHIICSYIIPMYTTNTCDDIYEE